MAPGQYRATTRGETSRRPLTLERLTLPTLDGTHAIIVGRFLFVAFDAPREAELAVVLAYSARHGLPPSAVAVTP